MSSWSPHHYKLDGWCVCWKLYSCCWHLKTAFKSSVFAPWTSYYTSRTIDPPSFIMAKTSAAFRFTDNQKHILNWKCIHIRFNFSHQTKLSISTWGLLSSLCPSLCSCPWQPLWGIHHPALHHLWVWVDNWKKL